MNKNFADISAFEALAKGSAGSSMSAFQTKVNVAVKNVDISLKGLADLVGDDELSSLVGFLESKGRLGYADNAFRGKSMGSVDELKRVILHGIGCSNMENFESMYGAKQAPEATKEDESPVTPDNVATKEARLSASTTDQGKKLGWWARRREQKAIAKEELELYGEFKKLSKKVKGTADNPYGNASPAQRARLDYILARINELEEQVSSL